MKTQTIQQKNNEDFEFWKRQFEPRTNKWQRETLRRLRSGISPFETADQNANKINALEALLNL